MDGFIEWSAQEIEFLAAVLPWCRRATLTYCLDSLPTKARASWISCWSPVLRNYERSRSRLSLVPGIDLATELLPRNPECSRFAKHPALTAPGAAFRQPNSVSRLAAARRRRLANYPLPQP